MVRLGAIEFDLNLKDNFTKVLRKAKETGSKTAQTIGQKFAKMGTAMKVVWATVGFVAFRFFRDLIKLTTQAEAAQARLVQQFKNVGIFSEQNIQSINRLANEIQDSTGISNDAIVSSAALAASYGLTATQIGELLPALADLTAFTSKSTGAQSQMEDTVKLMGFVLEGQVGRLKLMGITFTDVQKEMIATGTKAQKLTSFLEAVATNAGGVAAAMGGENLAQIKKFGNTFDDLKKEIGTQFSPVLAKTSTFMTRQLKNWDKGITIVAAKAAKFRTLIGGAYDLKPLNEINEELASIDKQLDDILDQMNGVDEINFDDTAASVQETVKSFSDMNKELTELNTLRQDALILEGAESTEFKNLNKQYKTLKATITEYNDILNMTNSTEEESLEITKKRANEIFEQMQRQIRLIESQRETGTGLKATTEELEELKKAVNDFESDNTKITDARLGKQEKVKLKQKDVNDQIKDEGKIIDETQSSRDQLNQDMVILAQSSQEAADGLRNVNTEIGFFSPESLNRQSGLFDLNQ